MELIIIILINFLFIVSAIFICENLAPIFCLLGEEMVLQNSGKYKADNDPDNTGYGDSLIKQCAI